MKKVLGTLLLFCLIFSFNLSYGQTTVKKVVLQGFWWDYWNSNYQNGWANYLSELAPRLKSMGIDAVWIPPSTKGNNGTGDVGYGPYDHYDLGDKNQKGNVKTRIGNKDELLRLIAVLHANGIEVIQDIVANHVIGAGDTSSVAGIDPDSWDSKYKLFRYSSWATPTKLGTVNEYRNKTGRFPKNWQNFHPNPADNCNSGDICMEMFGPDISYADGSNGQTNLTPVYDPLQTTYNPYNSGGAVGSSGNGYMRKGIREWLIWNKKQEGFDGVRLDATKNYDHSAAEDFLFNLQFNSGWASGGNKMFAVGEVVGSAAEQDSWTSDVNKRAGTFDFSLRGNGLKPMVDAGGFYDMSLIPGTQQNTRINFIAADNTYYNISTNFVNNHDTFRPNLSSISGSEGNYTSTWNTSNELGGGHIDPSANQRTALAYATMMALDGNSQVFFEDLFDIGTTGKRWSHNPTNTTDLPSRTKIENIIWCAQSLHFKDGAYKVRSAESQFYFMPSSTKQDLLVIERSAKALVCLNDNGAAIQEGWTNCDFPANTVLMDYSGHFSSTTTVGADQRVYIKAPKVDVASGNYGYSIWAPVGATSYVPSRNTETTQEWEMADDLGDINCSSLMQGGALPANSTHQRIVGKIYSAANKVITFTITPELSGNDITFSIWNKNGSKLFEGNAVTTTSSPYTGTYTPANEGWFTLKIRNTINTQPTQKAFVKISYTAPSIVNTATADIAPVNDIAIWSGNKNNTDISDCANWEQGKMPSATTNVLIPAYASPAPIFNMNSSVNNITIESGASLEVSTGNTLTVNGNWINNNSTNLSVCGKVSFSGTQTQTLGGLNTFCILEINNALNVIPNNNDIIVNNLILTNGKYILQNNLLTLNSGCTITGGSSNSYVKCSDASSAGYIIQEINNTVKNYPVGNADYTPVTVLNTGTTQNCKVKCFEDVLEHGLTGSPVTTTDKIIKTWEITPLSTGAVADMVFNWNTSNQDISFNKFNCFVMKNTGGSTDIWNKISTNQIANGSNPYSATATGINSFSKFTIYSINIPLPITILNFTVKNIQNNAIINWNVNDNSNNIENYEIEKSEDGIKFNKISTNDISTKTFTDKNFIQNSWYRLVIVSKDGKKTYSNIAYLGKSVKQQTFSIYPNPVNNYLKINLTEINVNEKVEAKLINSTGLLITNVKGTAKEIEDAINNKLATLNSGVYFIQFNTLTNIQVIKFLKENK